MRSHIYFDNMRDQFRDYLSSRDPLIFPRHGAVGTAMDLVLDSMTTNESYHLSAAYECLASPICSPPFQIPMERRLPRVLSSSQWIHWDRASDSIRCPCSATIQEWVDLALMSRSERQQSPPLTTRCGSSCAGPRHSELILIATPSLCVFDVVPGTTPAVLPSRCLSLPCLSGEKAYALRAVIYHGLYHFTSRVITDDGLVWFYDGRTNNGIPWIDETCRSTKVETHWNKLPLFDDRSAISYIYSLR